VPKIAELARDFGGRIQLAVSLSAGTMATRSEIVPITKRHDLASLQQACLDYPLPGARRFVLVEYVLLAGVTDTAEELAGLVEWVRPLRCLVNLIPWNGFEGASFESPTRESVMTCAETLRAAGVPTTIRAPRGREVGAACGQLVRAAP
jgi:23S rRNA (adenine2503-C2)-methyltransferase